MRNITEIRILESNFVLMGIDNLLQLTVNVLTGMVWTILGKGSFWEGGGDYNINYCTWKWRQLIPFSGSVKINFSWKCKQARKPLEDVIFFIRNKGIRIGCRICACNLTSSIILINKFIQRRRYRKTNIIKKSTVCMVQFIQNTYLFDKI